MMFHTLLGVRCYYFSLTGTARCYLTLPRDVDEGLFPEISGMFL